MHCGTVGGDKVRIKEMKKAREEFRETVRVQLQISIETAVQVMSVTKLITMFRVTKWDPVIIVQKM